MKLDIDALRDEAERFSYDYLDSKRGVGGYPAEWLEYWREKLRTQDIDASEDARGALLDVLAMQVWSRRRKRVRGNAELWLDGKACDERFSYYDDNVPGGKVTILFGHASIDQWRRHCDLVEDTRNRVEAKLNIKRDIFTAALDRAGGDMSKPISLFTDDKVGIATPDATDGVFDDEEEVEEFDD